MLVEKTEPYPHHRSVWIADTVRLKGGREVSVYNGLYSGVKLGEKDFGPPFRDHVLHVKFNRLDAKDDRADIVAELVWEMDESMPVLREKCRIGAGKTREDHSELMNQLYAAYAQGKNARELAVVLGESALTDEDVLFVTFSAAFEDRFIRQGEYENRTIEESLHIGWELLGMLPVKMLKRVRDQFIERYYPKKTS